MRKPLVRSLLFLIAAAVLSACGGYNNPGNVQAFPNCNPPGALVMVYPIPGNQNIPVSTQNVFFASSVGLGGGGFITAVLPPNGGSLFGGGPFVPVPVTSVPKPHAKPSFANPLYFESNIGGLTGASTYTIYFVNNTINCNPVTGTPAWTFTTI
jgi:hypothetical protein